jgi:hypothetical protein
MPTNADIANDHLHYQHSHAAFLYVIHQACWLKLVEQESNKRTKPNPGFCNSNTHYGRSSGLPSSFLDYAFPCFMHSGGVSKSSGLQQRGLRRIVGECISRYRLPVSPSSWITRGHHSVRRAFYTKMQEIHIRSCVQ